MTSPALLYTLWGDDQGGSISDAYEETLATALRRLDSPATTSTSTSPRTLVEAVKDICRAGSYDPDALHDLAVAAIFLHARHNLVGPYSTPSSSSSSTASSSAQSFDLLNELAENGEDFLGLVFHPEYLLIAKLAFGALARSHPSPAVSFWNFRVAAAVQFLLAERSQVLLERITSGVEALTVSYAEDTNDAHLLAVVHLEAANAYSVFGMVAEMKAHVAAAQRALGMEVALTGSLGMRTVHQQNAHAQLVAKVRTVDNDGDGGGEGGDIFAGRFERTALDDMAFNLVAGNGSGGVTDDSRERRPSEFRGFCESDADVFRGGPKLLDEEEAIRTDLNAVHQLVVLTLCNVVKKSSSPDGTQPWELTAYAECVLAQDRTEFVTRLAAYMELSRLEIQRSRTRERALCTMEGIKESLSAVVVQGSVGDAANATDATDATDAATGSHAHAHAHVAPADRMRYAFTCKSLPRAALWKELGEAFVACGLIGAAIKLFEEAELWDSLIVCYQLLEKNEIAEQLVRTRLEVTPEDARLWCTLGDLVDSEEHYHTAWSCSNGRSARAQRSLARSAMRREDFVLASDCWERALALSPLHLEAWFSLGWCNLKSANYEKAASALTRLVQMDPEDGRAWNNLATVHMKMENWPEALVAFGEASKHARDTWQTWENYAHVAFQVGDLNTSARALEHMVGLTRGETYNPKLVGSLVDALKDLQLDDVDDLDDLGDVDDVDDVGDVAPSHAPDPSARGSGGGTLPNAPKENPITTTTSQQLVNYVSTILKKIATSSKGAAGPGFWKTYARFYAITGAPGSEAECLTKHVRGLSTSTWHAQDDTFEEYAQSCVALARATLELPPPNTSGLGQCRMLLRSALQRSKETHEDHDAYVAMQRALDDVSSKLSL